MNKRNWAGLFLSFILLTASGRILAQQLDHLQGEVLIRLRPGADIRGLATEVQLFRGRNTAFRIHRRLNVPMNIWICRFDFAGTHEVHLLEELRGHPAVEAAQFNHFLELRSVVPDDPQFDRQWQYVNTGQDNGLPGADFDMDLAWDITKGGLTPTGDTIVVCVIDNGFDIRHEDFGGNIWINRLEFPENGFDDDGNGYIDDYFGWNTATESDDIDVENDNHGTPVAGIIGARGNNGVGVSGVNWELKLMIVAGGTGLESEALEAYAYPLALRRRYNQTNGREGAFVVATNASWGRNSVDPEDFPLWCAVYDSLGAAGIINIGATSNEPVDVDEEGDMPTGCGSPFLIGVTNIDRKNDLAANAGFGVKSIDLGAYGEEVWTVRRGNRYGRFNGTSAAAPHVAGAVALLYAAPCTRLMHLAQFDPAAAALLAKDYLLKGVLPTSSLEGKTLTGGRLNVFRALEIYLSECGECPAPAGLKAEELTERSAALTWQIMESVDRVDLRWRRLGTVDWQPEPHAESPFPLEGLAGCAQYEFQLRAYCGQTALSYTPSLVFRTEGCCETPRRFRLAGRGDRSATLQWDPVPAAREYQVRLLETGGDREMLVATPDSFASFVGLEPCAVYLAEVRTICPEAESDFGNGFTFSTSGCGSCLDLAYCSPTNADASAEWISEVELNTLEHFSGTDGGYGDFTGMPSTQLIAGKAYPIRLSPAFAGTPLFEYFQVWIDLDQDGSFSSRELVFDPGGTSRQPVSGDVMVPGSARLGKTRLRIAMKFRDPAGPCGFMERPFGEYEDYCIYIADQEKVCGMPASLDTAGVGPFHADLQWTAVDTSSAYLLRYRSKGEMEWKLEEMRENYLRLEPLSPCTEFEAQVKSVCGDLYGKFSEPFTFSTSCTTAGSVPSPSAGELQVFPNPFRETLRLHLSPGTAQRDLGIDLFDSAGRLMLRQTVAVPPGEQTISVENLRLPAGVYWLRIQAGKGQAAYRKVVKME